MSESTPAGESQTHDQPQSEYRRGHRLGTFEQAGKENDCSGRSIRNWATDGHYPLYKVPGVVGVLVDLDQVAAYVATRPKRYGGAEVIQLPRQAVVTDDRMGTDR